MESEIRQLLDKIRHPESEQGIVTAGSVERIEASPERIFVALRFAKARDPFAAKIRRQAEDDLFVIPDADGTAVLYNDGKIRFDEIADIEVGSVFVGILLRNGYLFYLSRTEPLKTCIYTHGGWGSISEISPRGIAGHIGRELHGKLGDHTAVD